MEVRSIIQFLLFILCAIGGLVILILVLRKSSYEMDYNEIIYELNKQEELDLKTLENGNKEIDKIERKILNCKKELGIKLFKKSNK